jgi:6-phosphogluconolactonase (cycloisomerase 2 family)
MHSVLRLAWPWLSAAALTTLLGACGDGQGSSSSGNTSTTTSATTAPTVSLTASATSITSGQPLTLTWSSTNASSCIATGPWGGIEPLSGNSSQTPATAGVLDYTLTCNGALGSATQSVSVTVAPGSGGSVPPAAPAVTIAISSPTLVAGQSTVLTWSTSNATTCAASGAWNGVEGTSGSISVTPTVTGNLVYALNCSGPGGSTAGSVPLTVSTSSNTSPVVTIAVSPASIVVGQSATLSWSTSHVTSCTASATWVGPQNLSGTQVVMPAAAGNYPYTLNCTGASGSASNTGTLQVVNAYSLGGAVTGLAGTGLVLADTAGDTLPVAANGNFVFPARLATGTPYTVKVQAQPSGQSCTIANGSGTMGTSNISNVAVSCASASFIVGGSIAGLSGSGLVLQDNAGSNLSIATGANSFTFAAPLANGATYAVTILTQPTHQACLVAKGTGTVTGSNITNVVINCASQYAYVSNYGDKTLSQFIIASDGQLLPMATATVATDTGPAALALEASGKYAYAANQGSADVSQFAIGATGTLTAMSAATVPAGTYPSSIVADPSGKYVYVSNKGDGTLSQFSISTSGALTPLAAKTAAAGAQPFRIALTPDGKYAYVTNLQSTVSQYSLGATGGLSPLTTTQVNAGQWPLGLATDPASQHVYVTNSGQCLTCADGTISQYSIDASGNLTPLTTATISAGSWPIAITLAPSGKYAYVANSGDNTVSQYAIGSDGSLSPMTPATVPAGTRPASIRLDASGQYAYVVNAGDNTVSEYAVGSTGGLTPLSTATVTVGTAPSAMVIGSIR